METEFVSVTKMNLLMLFKKIIALYFENKTKLYMPSVGKMNYYFLSQQVMRVFTSAL
jgi:hypothetical protein